MGKRLSKRQRAARTKRRLAKEARIVDASLTRLRMGSLIYKALYADR